MVNWRATFHVALGAGAIIAGALPSFGALPDLPAVVGSPPHRSAPHESAPPETDGSPGLFSPGSPSLCV